MFGRNALKRGLKYTVGRVAALAASFTPPPPPQRACILVYHRIASPGFIDASLDDWNVPPRVFEAHVKALTNLAEIVSLSDLQTKLRSSSSFEKPLVALTFDDGYSNFYTQALPVLQRYHVPATLFVVTDSVGGQAPMAFDRWALKNKQRTSAEAWRPISWSEIESCLASGQVTLGSHSHRHLNGKHCDRADLEEEVEQSRSVLISRLGAECASMYAYPYGSTRLGHVPVDYPYAVRAAGYQLAVTTDLALASPKSDPYLLPRIEAHAMDSPRVLRAKVYGALGPYRFTDRLRKAERNR